MQSKVPSNVQKIEKSWKNNNQEKSGFLFMITNAVGQQQSLRQCDKMARIFI